jgi:tyrosine-protein phosphatase non-receptor type 4
MLTIFPQKKSKGQELLDKVFVHLELVEKDYFGLQFSENGTAPSATNDSMVKRLYFFITKQNN